MDSDLSGKKLSGSALHGFFAKKIKVKQKRVRKVAFFDELSFLF